MGATQKYIECVKGFGSRYESLPKDKAELFFKDQQKCLIAYFMKGKNFLEGCNVNAFMKILNIEYNPQELRLFIDSSKFR